jgi:tRNA(Arg) A34 adenosine deaminase TadA
MNRYMKIAKELADDNLKTNVGGPFGACVVKDGEVVGRGSNHVLANNDPTAHAEVMAIRDACKNLGTYDLSGCIVYTSCYPCPMCLSAIIWANVKTVYYGNTKKDADKIGFRDDFMYEYIAQLTAGFMESDLLDMQELDREETIKSFEAFERKEDRTIY